MENKMTLRFCALSHNESFARVSVGVFASLLNPTLSQLADIKTAVSEAVTNSIIHAYEPGQSGEVELYARLYRGDLYIEVRDFGRGIKDVEKALTPFYTSCEGDERSGMGFTVMETFMDELEVISEPGKGTVVRMTKHICNE